MFQNLLVPLDGSKFGEFALSYALSLAEKYNSQIVLLHIAPTSWQGEMRAELPEGEALSQVEELRDTADYFREKEAALKEAGYQVTAVILQGAPIHAKILEAATQENVDTIIMSTHGFTGVKRMIFGNIAEKVIKEATIPVLVIRPSET